MFPRIFFPAVNRHHRMHILRGISWFMDSPSPSIWIHGAREDKVDCRPKRIIFQQKTNLFAYPIGSMYGIFPYIYHKNQPNVGKYTIHGSYGYLLAALSSRNTEISAPCNHFCIRYNSSPEANWCYCYFLTLVFVVYKNRPKTNNIFHKTAIYSHTFLNQNHSVMKTKWHFVLLVGW